jgi:3-methyladenine DNA glycosylase AlkC
VKERIVRNLAVLAAALLLAACTFTRLAYTNAALAYDNAAPMLTWVVGDYVDLSGEQKEWVRQRLRKALDRHRQRELPQYRALLRYALQRADAPFSEADVEHMHDEVRDCYHRTLEYILPDAAELLSQLDADQVRYLQDKLDEDSRKYQRESKKDRLDERRRKEAAKFVEHIESWVGDLSHEQEELVLQRVRAFDDFSRDRLADRRYRQTEVLRLVHAHLPREEMVASLRRLFIDTDSWRAAEYRQKLRQREQQVSAMLAELSATFTPEQRSHFAARVRGFLRDIDQLTAVNDRGAGGNVRERATSGS